jgi:hypothetical protein
MNICATLLTRTRGKSARSSAIEMEFSVADVLQVRNGAKPSLTSCRNVVEDLEILADCSPRGVTCKRGLSARLLTIEMRPSVANGVELNKRPDLHKKLAHSFKGPRDSC